MELFADFEFKIEHVAGVANRTDALSRQPDLSAGAAVGVTDDFLERIRGAQAESAS